MFYSFDFLVYFFVVYPSLSYNSYNSQDGARSLFCGLMALALCSVLADCFVFARWRFVVPVAAGILLCPGTPFDNRHPELRNVFYKFAMACSIWFPTVHWAVALRWLMMAQYRDWCKKSPNPEEKKKFSFPSVE